MHYEINNDAFIYEDCYNEDYNDDYTITLYSYFPENFFFIPTQNIDKNKKIVSIKSELNNNRTKAIIWWNYEGDNQTRYFIYNLYDLTDLYSSKMPNTCINSKYEPRKNVFPYKNQIAFSCTMEDENIQIILYNKTDLMKDSYIINVSCENNNEISKLYFNDNKNYLIYPCFKNCSNKIYENDIDCLNKGKNEENKESKRSEEENEEENKGENKEGNKRSNEENKKSNTIMIIIIIAIIIILLIFSIFILRKYFKINNLKRSFKKGKEEEKLMEDIYSDLLPINQK